MRQVVEIAPAYGLDDAVRQRLHDDAVKLAKHVGYVRCVLAEDAGTANDVHCTGIQAATFDEVEGKNVAALSFILFAYAGQRWHGGVHGGA